MMEADLVAYLTADSGVAAVIDDRLYPELLPQNPTLPAIVYTSISESEEELMDGTGEGLMGRLVQFTAWAQTDIAAATAMQAVKDAMRVIGLPSTSSPPPDFGVMRGANVENVRSGYDYETKYFRRDADFRVWHI